MEFLKPPELIFLTQVSHHGVSDDEIESLVLDVGGRNEWKMQEISIIDVPPTPFDVVLIDVRTNDPLPVDAGEVSGEASAAAAPI